MVVFCLEVQSRREILVDDDEAFEDEFEVDDAKLCPILSSGTCTEVFQFEVSPSTIVPATPVANTTDKLPTGKIKNQRALYGQSIPLNGSSRNETEHFGKPTESRKTFNGNNSASSVVVSVMADPREAGDGDGHGMIRPKSLSRIFVVVLILFYM